MIQYPFFQNVIYFDKMMKSKVQQPQQYTEFFQSVDSPVKKKKFNQISIEVMQQHRIKIIKQRQSAFFNMVSKFGDSYFGIRGYKEQGTSFLYDVVLGQFVLRINVLNINRDAQYSEIPQSQKLGQGGFGLVRKVQVGKQTIAVKRIFLENKNHNELALKVCPFDKADKNMIRRAIRQYCIYKICSMLEIGPMIIFQQSHDIVCYNDCIEFAMQLCQNPRNQPNLVNVTDFEADLKYSTRLLHRIGFVHRDIKPANILFSTHRNKFILGDFGIAHTVAENVGEKTATGFSGTFQYVSEQLLELYGTWDKGMVDLYLNDMVALKVTLKQLNQLKKVRIQTFSSNAMSYQESQSYMEPISNTTSQVYRETTQMMKQSEESQMQYTQNQYKSKQQKYSKESQISRDFRELRDSSDDRDRRASMSSIDTSFLTSSTAASILNQYNCQINFYINTLLYQILFKEIELIPQLIKKLINQLCQRQQNPKISQYLTTRIGRILWIDLQQLDIQIQKSNKQLQDDILKRFIKFKQKNRYEIQKQKLQYFIRHYGFTIETLDLVQNILKIYTQLDQQQIKIYKKIIKEIQRRNNQSTNFTSETYTHVVLANYNEQAGYIRKKINHIKKQIKQGQEIDQNMLNILKLQYINMLGTQNTPYHQQELTDKSMNELNQLLPKKLVQYSKLPKYQSFLPDECQIKCNCSICLRLTYFQLAKYAFECICKALQNGQQNNKFWKEYRLSFLASLQIFFNLSRYDELITYLIRLQSLYKQGTFEYIFQWDFRRTIITLKCELRKIIIQKQNQLPGLKFEMIECLQKKTIFENICEFENSIEKHVKNTQQQQTLKSKFLTTCYDSFSRCLIAEKQFKIAQEYLKKSLRLKQLQYYSASDTYQAIFTKNNFAILYLNEGKYQQARSTFMEVIKYLRRQYGNNTILKLHSDIYNNLAFIDQKQGKYQQALKHLKIAYASEMLLGSYVEQKLIYYSDNIVLLLILLNRIPEIKQYAIISLKSKINFVKFFFKCAEENNLSNQNFMKLMQFAKAIDLSLVRDKVTEAQLVPVIQMYISLIYQQQWIFKNQLKIFCETIAEYYYKQKKYLKFMKYIYIYLMNIDISRAEEHDFYRYDAYVMQLMKKNMYRRGLKMLKKYIFYIPDNMKQIRDLAYKKLMEIHRQLQLPQADIYKEIYQQKLYISRQFEYVQALFKWKYGYKPHYSKKLKVFRKVLKLI